MSSDDQDKQVCPLDRQVHELLANRSKTIEKMEALADRMRYITALIKLSFVVEKLQMNSKGKATDAQSKVE